MTQNDTPPVPPAGAPQPAATPPAEAAGEQKNTVGLVALILSIVGFIFACVPGALIVGWLLLPAGFVTGIVAITRKGQKKGTGIAAIAVSVVGTIVGAIVFMTVVAGAVSDAFDEAADELTGGEVTVAEPTTDAQDADAEDTAADAADTDDTAADASTSDDDAAADEDAAVEADTPTGTRDNPLAFGAVIENNDWSISFTGFNADANAEVAAGNMFNDEPEPGTQWIIVEAAATYTGSDSSSTLGLGFDYVGADGAVADLAFASGLEPDFDRFAELYEGGTEEGKIAFMVPDTLDGLLRITPGLFADDVFFELPAE